MIRSSSCSWSLAITMPFRTKIIGVMSELLTEVPMPAQVLHLQLFGLLGDVVAKNRLF